MPRALGKHAGSGHGWSGFIGYQSKILYSRGEAMSTELPPIPADAPAPQPVEPPVQPAETAPAPKAKGSSGKAVLIVLIVLLVLLLAGGGYLFSQLSKAQAQNRADADTISSLQTKGTALAASATAQKKANDATVAERDAAIQGLQATGTAMAGENANLSATAQAQAAKITDLNGKLTEANNQLKGLKDFVDCDKTATIDYASNSSVKESLIAYLEGQTGGFEITDTRVTIWEDYNSDMSLQEFMTAFDVLGVKFHIYRAFFVWFDHDKPKTQNAVYDLWNQCFLDR
jgi:hypothetical protein